MPVPIRRPEDNLQNSVLSFHVILGLHSSCQACSKHLFPTHAYVSPLRLLSEKIIQFLGLTGSPYRSLLRIQYGVSIICKRVEKACSLLLQMQHSGGTLLYRVQIKSLDSNTNETGRVLLSIPQQVRNGHSTAGSFRRLGSARQHRRLTSVSAMKRWIVLKMVFSFLNFWSVKLALVC